MVAVPAIQALLFPDPCPLVDRLGRDFFRQLPERPGVYLMRDARSVVLYVGKAKNLRKRLGSYRVANPDRMPRRHLRMLRAVERIELQECPDETAALARESELLRALKPRFNRAGTWPATPRYFVWRCAGTNLELAVTETPEAGWRAFGPLDRGAVLLRAVVVRLSWFSVHPEPGIFRMPAGWAKGRFENQTAIHCGRETEDLSLRVAGLCSGQPDAFCGWVRERMGPALHPFDKAAVEKDLEFISDFFPIAP